MDGFRLRPASPADASAAAQLLAGAGLPAVGEGAQFGPQYVIAEDANGSAVAMAGVEVHGGCGLLRSVVVDPTCRSTGTGAAVTLDRIEWAHRQGLGELYLLTTTAAGYFPRFGFAVIERADAPAAIAASDEWRSLCPASAVAMRLIL